MHNGAVLSENPLQAVREQVASSAAARPFNILLVDDTEANRYAIARYLRREGYEVWEAATGQEALRLAMGLPDLVILDVQLPDLIGFEVCRQLRENPRTSVIPILHISATFRLASDKIRGLDGGADGYLTGPVEPAELVANVRVLLRLHSVQEALRQSNEFLRAVTESTSDLIFAKDRKGRMIFANPSTLRVIGKSEEEVLGRTDLEWSPHPEQAHRAMVTDQRVMETGKIESLDEEYGPPGNTRFFRSVKAPLRNPAGEIVGVVGTTRDVTERKRAEDALQASEERFRKVFENAPTGIAITDWAGRFVQCNAAYSGIVGYSAEELRQMIFSDLVHPEDREENVRQVRRVLERELPFFKIENRYVHKNGHPVWVQKYVTLLRDDSDGPAFMVALVTDITEIRALNEALEQRVQERTAKLQEAVAELEGFTHSITHDMRAPLRAMQGFANILLSERRDRLDAETLEYLQRISSAANRLDHLILDALDYGKIVRAETTLRPVDTDKLVQEIIRDYPEFQPPRAHVTIDGPLPAVLGNEALLTQCFSNLLNNGVRFVAKGTVPRIRIYPEHRGQMCRICVQDNGIGISQEHHERIFQMFERLHGQEFPGTGIGLAIVRKAVERLGGRCGLHSEPGKGSCFWIELPPQALTQKQSGS